MKDITIEDESLKYQVFDVTGSNSPYSFITKFYNGTEIITERKYLFFGEKQEKIQPKFYFEVPFNIEEPTYSKIQMRALIMRYYNVALRIEEIKNNQII